MQLGGKFGPVGKVRRIGSRKLKSRRSLCYRCRSSGGLRSVTRLVPKLPNSVHATLNDDCERFSIALIDSLPDRARLLRSASTDLPARPILLADLLIYRENIRYGASENPLPRISR